ncbi:MAG: hypothetical protein QW561_02485, partial [Candidatus Aenigmatarchaeota archaeon]
MSESREVPISTPITGLSDIVEGAGVVAAGAVAVAAVAIGGVCWAMGSGMIRGCKEVYKMCKEGQYPVENLQMAYTPISNLDGLTQMLKRQGFKLDSKITAPDLGVSIAFNPLTSERLFLVNSTDGISLISETKDLIQSSIQGFATQEISLALQEVGFKVTVEEKGKDKVITAHDSQKNHLEFKIERGTTTVKVDT